MSFTARKILKHPIQTTKRFIRKKFVESKQYASGNGYDAEKYWTDRHEKHGMDIRGSGNEGHNEAENAAAYTLIQNRFIEVCATLPSPLGADLSVLEIGCGNGLYAALLEKHGVRKYTGLDITDTLFSELQEKFPEFSFIQSDCTEPTALNTQFDMIIMMDVLIHIVEDDKMRTAMENVKKWLKDDGVFIVEPITKKNMKHFFYNRDWALTDIQNVFEGYTCTAYDLYEDRSIVMVRQG